VDVTTGSSVFSTLLFHQMIPPREILRSNLAPDRQYQTTTTTNCFSLFALYIDDLIVQAFWILDSCRAAES